MLNNETIAKLNEMHMGTMAAGFAAQLADLQFQDLSFEERFRFLAKASHNKNVTAVTKPATEDPDNLPLSLQITGGFTPANLNGITRIALQRHIRLSRDILRFHFMDHTAGRIKYVGPTPTSWWE